MDAISEARLGVVHPMLREKIQRLAYLLALENINIRVAQGLRTWAVQALLYAQGRTAPGKIVTNGRPGQSWHNFGLAVDVVPDSALAAPGVFEPDWDETHPAWQRIVAIGESLGLTSGAHFRTIKDFPHLQLTGKFPASPPDDVRGIFLASGIQGVWDAAQIE